MWRLILTALPINKSSRVHYTGWITDFVVSLEYKNIPPKNFSVKSFVVGYTPVSRAVSPYLS